MPEDRIVICLLSSCSTVCIHLPSRSAYSIAFLEAPLRLQGSERRPTRISRRTKCHTGKTLAPSEATLIQLTGVVRNRQGLQKTIATKAATITAHNAPCQCGLNNPHQTHTNRSHRSRDLEIDKTTSVEAERRYWIKQRRRTKRHTAETIAPSEAILTQVTDTEFD